MTTLRFHRSIYAPAAVSEAVAVFAGHGQLRIDDSEPEHVVVELVAPEQEDALAGAFGNYVLGASVHSHQRQS